ncbi:LysM peptidoglycan-binding domain-containing protein [Flavobacterium sp.]|uniref:C40 family peptidase n=1 Tax=Flavobacterium sp. TaxID=239 RepID=UPI002BF700A7|nr:LysM peptidoglycan-binding domain-containing protein [Flavobacterium sp.]HSD06060.1 LysM peptidoglycan-binding domain-containing protein [Flavobacterium sp.]
MKYLRIIVLALFLSSISVFAQDNTIKHTIVKGETISSIAQKYNVSMEAIYKLNPKAKKTLQLKQVLLIPNSEPTKTSNLANTVSEKTTDVTHEVMPKETLYGITKQFKTTTELLYKANPKLETEGLKVGQKIIIPSKFSKKEIESLSNTNSNTEETVVAETPLTHQVKAKESLYSIAKIYGITLAELQNANPTIGKKGLSIGQTITIPGNARSSKIEPSINKESLTTNEIPVSQTPVPVIVEKEKNQSKTVSAETPTTETIHVVLSKETKYGIAKKYGITIAELENQNPAIKQKLEVGAKLTIQVPNNRIDKTTINQENENIGVATQMEKKQDSAATHFPVANEELIDKLIGEASDKIGTRYRTGGTTTAGFDCSGLMCSTFGAFDIKLPRSSIEQSSIGEKIDGENAQKGDLIFFKTNGRRHINHVGMVIEVNEDEIKFIHSSTHSGVIISSTKEPYYKRNFAQVNRIIK